MRKGVAIAVVALVGAGALWLAFHGEPTDSEPGSDDGSRAVQDGGAHPARVDLQALLRRASSASAPVARLGELSGKVVGPEAGGASVAVSGGAIHRLVTAAADGTFRIGELPEGEYRLDATSGALAAETLGPVPLGAGEQIEGLVLALVESGSLSGEVLDAQSHEPIGDATLSAGGASTRSDARGRFELRGLPPGEATLSVAHEGYVASTTRVSVPRNRRQTGATLLLARAAQVSGTVKLADGTPVPGAQLLAQRYGFGAGEQATAVAVSDAQGHFQADVGPGRVTLIATLGTGEGRSADLDVHPGEARTGVEIILDAGGEIVGQVLEADGTPAAGVSVVAVEMQTQRASSVVTAGLDGRFQLSALPEGYYDVVARNGARAAQQAGLHMLPGDTLSAKLQFGSSTVDGRVLDASGQPLSGAEIRVAPEGAATVAASAVGSGAGGRFHIEGLSGTRFTLKAVHAAGSVERHGIEAGAKDVELRIAAESAVAGLVTDENGRAVTDFRVLADPVSAISAALPGARASGHFASVAGTFHLAVQPGRYRVRVAAFGFATADAGEVEAPAQGESTELRVALHHTRVIVGKVLDARSHKPIAGARLATNPNLLFAYGRAAPVQVGGFTVSEPDGHFTMSDAEQGEVSLFATADGYAWGAPLRLAANNGGPVEVQLQPGGGGGPEDFAGVGMQITQDFHIGNVFDGGPAYLAGVRQGDLLLTVDGVPVAGHGLSEVVNWIRGEVGTPVALGIQRGADSAVLVATRAPIKF